MLAVSGVLDVLDALVVLDVYKICLFCPAVFLQRDFIFVLYLLKSSCLCAILNKTLNRCKMSEPKYKRILLKLSGEALAGVTGFGLDYPTITKICEQIKVVYDLGVQIGIVVGGGNFWRGRQSGAMDRTRADHIGMLGTTMNALAVADVLEEIGAFVRVQTAIHMQEVAEPYIRNKAVRHLEKGRIVIFGCGTGLPFFSTDTAATLRAVEIEADVIFKATMVDGVYDKDPKKFNDAVRFSDLKLSEMLSKNLNIMDATAAAMCRDNEMPVYVFNVTPPENIVKAVLGEGIGTIVN